MLRGRLLRVISLALLVVGLLVCAPPTWGKPKFKILHGFNGKDGAGLWGNLIFDKKGNLYGPTGGGGEALRHPSRGQPARTRCFVKQNTISPLTGSVRLNFCGD